MGLLHSYAHPSASTAPAASVAGEWGAADDEESDLILGRIALALDRAAGHYGPRADRLVASARDGTKRLLAAMDAASLDGCVVSHNEGAWCVCVVFPPAPVRAGRMSCETSCCALTSTASTSAEGWAGAGHAA